MFRFRVGIALVAVGVILAALGTARNSVAAPGDWFSYTNEAGDNNPTNLLNWRWSRDAAMPGGVAAWGNPTSVAQLQTTRSFVSAAGSGFSQAKGNVYDTLDIGAGVAFQLFDTQIDGGVVVNVHGAGGTLTLNGVSANGLGLNVVRDMPSNLMPNPQGGDGWGNTARYYRPNGAVTSNPNNNKNWFGNSKETTLRIYGGGTLNNTGGTTTGIASGIGPIGHLGYDIDSTQGAVAVAVAGTYSMGGSAASGVGGGFLQLRGYHPATSITMNALTINAAKFGVGISNYSDTSAGMTGSYGLKGISNGTDYYNSIPPNTNVAPIAGNYLTNIYGPTDCPLTYDSDSAQLRVQLTGLNAGGLFNKITVAGAITIPTLATNVNWNKKATFALSLNGYTPVVNDLFTIATAASVDGGGDFDVGWNTNFTAGGATWQLLNTNAGTPGIYLQVTATGTPDGNGTWKGGADANWATKSSNDNNWNTAYPVANFTATFDGTQINTYGAVNLQGAKTVGHLALSGTNDAIGVSGDILTFDAAGTSTLSSSNTQTVTAQVKTSATVGNNLLVTNAALGILHLDGGIDNTAAKTVTLTNASSGTLTTGGISNSGTLSVTTGSAVTSGNISGSAGATTLASNGSLTIGTTGSPSRIVQNSLTINGTSGSPNALVKISAGPASPVGGPSNTRNDNQTSRLTTLTIASSAGTTYPTASPTNVYYGTLDLTNNSLFIPYGANPGDDVAAYNAIEDMVRSGYNLGDWLGKGITSSTAATTDPFLYGVNVYDNAIAGLTGYTSLGTNTIVAKYGYNGDTNGDGSVTADDYTVVDLALASSPLYYMSLMNGDTNHDGQVTADDYTYIDINILSDIANPGLNGGVNAVPLPEPSSLALGLLGLVGLLFARRTTTRQTA